MATNIDFLGLEWTDDVLDYTQTQSVTGKPSGQDLREHKITLPLITARAHMSASELAQVERLMAEPEPGPALIADVIGAVRRVGGVELSMEKALRVSLEAEQELEGVPDSQARQGLHDCIAYAVDRSS